MKRVERLSFSDLFDTIIVGGEDTEESKPGPEPFEIALSEIGVSPGESVMVGDKPFTDMKGAKAVGMRAVLVKRRDWGGSTDPDMTIESLSELRSLF